MGKTVLGTLLKKRDHGGSIGNIGKRIEARMGKIPFSGRYHREPRKLEDDYILSDNVLGSGYNGEVRLATSVSKQDQKFAVKSLQLGSSLDNLLHRDKRKHLEAEVENYLAMDHPHITRLYDVYESKHQLHLVMECMEGGELFEKIVEKKMFSEKEASAALRQMLLALNYIHSHGIVHRDIKLENFIYDSKSRGHLKLIDFGFSKMMDPTGRKKMEGSLGTLAYVAPEVLDSDYTSQCDMWSLGVCGFILLVGYMPFRGSDYEQVRSIRRGAYQLRPERWAKISDGARDFIASLLEVDPNKRFTAQRALQHSWIVQHRECSINEEQMQPCCEALRRFSHASKFKRCCLEMLAWSLSNKDRAKVRECFLSLDTSQQGTITLQELKEAMVNKLHLVDESEVLRVFQALDYNHDQEIHYSDFLAAMADTQIDVDDEVLHDTFRRFDTRGLGYITAKNLRDILGNDVDGECVESFIAEADANNDGQLSYSEFVAFLKGGKLNDIDDMALHDVAEEGFTQKMYSTTGCNAHASWNPLKRFGKCLRHPHVAAAGA